MTKPEEELYSIAEAASALSDSAQGLTKVMLDLNDSKLWTIISRVSSGILPGFWSIQNKIRAVTDIVAMNQKSITEQQQRMIENMETIQKLGKQADLVMDLKIFDEETMDKFSKTAKGVMRAEKSHIGKKVYDDIGKEIEGFKHLEKAILGDVAKTQSERAEVLQEVKELIEPQRQRILDRQKEVKKARDFEKDLKKEFGKLKNFDPKKDRLRAFLVKQKLRIKKFLEFFTWKKVWDFIKGASMLFLKVVLFVGLFLMFTFAFYRTVKENKTYFAGLKKLLLMMLDWFVFSLTLIGEGIGNILTGFREGKLDKVFIGFGKVILGVLGAVFIPILAIVVGLFGTVIGILISGFFDVKKSGEGLVSATLQLLFWVAAIYTVLLFIKTGAIIPMLVLAITAGIANIFGGIGRSTGGVVNEGMTLVGEKGPEFVSLPAGSRVYTNQQSRSMGGNTVINVNVSGRVGASDAEIKDIANKVAREINLRMNRTATTGARF